MSIVGDGETIHPKIGKSPQIGDISVKLTRIQGGFLLKKVYRIHREHVLDVI